MHALRTPRPLRPALFRYLAIGTLVTAALAAAAPADACTCINGRPFCESMGNADAVFEATVDATDRVTRDEAGPAGFKIMQVQVRLRDVKSWLGTTQDQIFTGLGGGDCGYNFVPGVRYLITAYRAADGTLSTSICSQTRPLSQAGPQLEFLTSIPQRKSGGTLNGTVVARDAQDRTSPERAASVRVVVKGPVIRSAVTDPQGAFSIGDLPTGDYEVALTPPVDRPELAPDPRMVSKVAVKNTFACVSQTFTLRKTR